jgi:hypothetical protein
MTTLHLKSNPELSLALGEEYFTFRWKEKLKKEVFIRASILALLLFIILFAITKNIFFLSGVICSLAFIVYSAAIFFSAKRRYLKLIRKSKVEEFEMTYSDKGINYKFPKAESNFEWSYFKYYEQNADVFYLYNNSGTAIADILSERKLGVDAFLEIKALVITNIQKK